MDRDYITVVSGLPRSGTSMLMKMLDDGGIPPLTDEIRTADEDNPKGYYEFERVKKLPDDMEWLPDAVGKAVKVLAELVTQLPSGHDYRIVFIHSNIDEILPSQKKMIIRRGEDPDAVPDSELRMLFATYLQILKSWIEEQDNVTVLYVHYNEILEDPAGAIEAMDGFLGGLDTEAMAAAIDDRLYRNRA